MGKRVILSFGAALMAVRCLAATVTVNEVCYKNSATADASGYTGADWIELYNAGSTPVNMLGWYLSDNPEKPLRWQMPDAEIAPGGFLVVFASGKDVRGREIHTGFSLSAGETVILSTPLGNAADSVELPLIAADHSWARDESGAWSERAVPTPGR